MALTKTRKACQETICDDDAQKNRQVYFFCQGRQRFRPNGRSSEGGMIAALMPASLELPLQLVRNSLLILLSIVVVRLYY